MVCKQYKQENFSLISGYFSKREIARYTNTGWWKLLSILSLYRSEFYLLWDDNKVIGTGVIRWKWSRESHAFGWWLYAIWIHPNHRGNGFGEVLMNELITILKLRNISKVELTVDINNIVAINLYKKIGFVEVKQVSNYIVMQYDL